MRKANATLRKTLCEVANAAIKTNSQFKDKHKTLMIRRGYKRSVMAIAHKILRVIHYVFTHKQHYKDPGIDYTKLMVARNASRWIKALAKYDYPIVLSQRQTTKTKKILRA